MEYTDANNSSIDESMDIWWRKCNSSLDQLGAVWIFRNTGLKLCNDLFTWSVIVTVTEQMILKYPVFKHLKHCPCLVERGKTGFVEICLTSLL